ncbi:MAG TPA: peptidase M15 [Saprospiraceae bacterium]|nr:peptidase M15 [Saprospiraceae bacterium]
MTTKYLGWLTIFFLISCHNQPSKPPVKTLVKPPKVVKKKVYPTIPGFTNIQKIAPTIALDIRYATKDNFTGEQIYPCPACYLRPEVAAALASANTKLRKKGYGIKVFDCYRPRPAQQRLWDKVPNPNYVTPPSKGSMHNRGMAVDLTIFDVKKMRELYMGSPYDFFGMKAHTDYPSLSQKVIRHRKILTDAMTEAGFKGIRTEWWHFYYVGPLQALSDVEWECK